MTINLLVRRYFFLAAALFALLLIAFPSFAQQQPWMNSQLSPDARADLVLKEMTLDEKIDLLHGNGMRGVTKPSPSDALSNGGAGFVLGVPRLGIPMIQISDAAYGIRNSGENGRYSTALPSNLAAAASWDTQAACEYGSRTAQWPHLRISG
jgi:beta-glucosidase